MMIKLFENVSKEVEKELKRANKEFPQFNSLHEGIGIIDEEYTETLVEEEKLKDKMIDLKQAVYSDCPKEVIDACRCEVENAATLLACEAIQVAAMARKFEPLTGKQIELVFGYHFGCGMLFTWQNPAGYVLKAGDIVLADTKYGAQYVQVTGTRNTDKKEAEQHKCVLGVVKSKARMPSEAI